MNAAIQIRTIGPPHRDLLITMYDRFDPLAGSLGLPPGTAEARHGWIRSALRQMLNPAAFWPDGEVGHCFLAGSRAQRSWLSSYIRNLALRR